MVAESVPLGLTAAGPDGSTPPLMARVPSAPSFRLALRGYDSREVDRYTRLAELELEASRVAQRALATDVRSLAEQLDRANEEVAVLRRRPAVDDAVAFKHLGPRVEQILADAHAEADELRASAERDATQLRSRVEQQVTDVREAHARAVTEFEDRRRWLHEEEERWTRLLRSRQEQVARAEQYRRRIQEGAEEILESAHQQHEKVLASALQRSEQILAKARAEADELRESARRAALTEAAAILADAQPAPSGSTVPVVEGEVVRG